MKKILVVDDERDIVEIVCELLADNGYQTLTDNAEIYYQTSEFYAPNAAKGVRYNDPAFGIEWPLEVASISEADQNWPDYH